MLFKRRTNCRARGWLYRLALSGGCCALVGLSLQPARGDSINIGAVSFDGFIPADVNTPGVNAVDVGNFTGGFALPPDFPVASDLVFQNATLTLNLIGQAPQVIALPDIGPGFLLDSGGNPLVLVPGDESVSSVKFSAVLSPLVFGLDGGSSVSANSSSIEVLLVPSSGDHLIAGVDLATISVSTSPVPEPATAATLLFGLIGLLWCTTKTRYKSSATPRS